MSVLKFLLFYDTQIQPARCHCSTGRLEVVSFRSCLIFVKLNCHRAVAHSDRDFVTSAGMYVSLDLLDKMLQQGQYI
jgi:hypothetical protein